MLDGPSPSTPPVFVRYSLASQQVHTITIARASTIQHHNLQIVHTVDVACRHLAMLSEKPATLNITSPFKSFPLQPCFSSTSVTSCTTFTGLFNRSLATHSPHVWPAVATSQHPSRVRYPLWRSSFNTVECKTRLRNCCRDNSYKRCCHGKSIMMYRINKPVRR